MAYLTPQYREVLRVLSDVTLAWAEIGRDDNYHPDCSIGFLRRSESKKKVEKETRGKGIMRHCEDCRRVRRFDVIDDLACTRSRSADNWLTWILVRCSSGCLVPGCAIPFPLDPSGDLFTQDHACPTRIRRTKAPQLQRLPL